MTTKLLNRLAEMPIRDDIPNVLNEFGLLGPIAEIGVMWGWFTHCILSEWKGNVFYCIDPWESQSKEVYKERTDTVDYEKCYQQMRDYAKQEQRILLMRGLSTQMARFIPDGSLDFVFIDGNHAYTPVLEDMDTWFPKVKVGGIFSGHDYYNDTNYPNFCEVKSAVDRWMEEHKLKFVIDKHGSSWWSVKHYGSS